MKTYQFWSKQGNNPWTLTEKIANSKKEIRIWAK